MPRRRRHVPESQTPEALLLFRQALVQKGGEQPRGGLSQSVREWSNVALGNMSSLKLQRTIERQLCSSHVLTDISLEQKGCSPDAPFISSADLEETYYNFVLCGQSDGSVSVFDTTKLAKSNCFECIRHTRSSKRHGHKHAITCIQWYPIDNGLFTTSSCDKYVTVWDSETLCPVDQFKLTCQVRHHSMSLVATQHSLVAASGENGEIFLCDLKSGSSTQTLRGHEGSAEVTKWSKINQYELLSGGCDKSIRLWDVRHGKACVQVLGQKLSRLSSYHEELTRRSKKHKVTYSGTHSGHVTSLEFTYDGLYLISRSSNGQCKAWNTTSWQEIGTPFHGTSGSNHSHVKMTVSRNISPDIVYIPCHNDICAYEVQTGNILNVLQGHFSSILGVIFNPVTYALYTYGMDKYFLVWTPHVFLANSKVTHLEDNTFDAVHSSHVRGLREDTWSSDED